MMFVLGCFFGAAVAALVLSILWLGRDDDHR